MTYFWTYLLNYMELVGPIGLNVYGETLSLPPLPLLSPVWSTSSLVLVPLCCMGLQCVSVLYACHLLYLNNYESYVDSDFRFGFYGHFYL